MSWLADSMDCRHCFAAAVPTTTTKTMSFSREPTLTNEQAGKIVSTHYSTFFAVLSVLDLWTAILFVDECTHIHAHTLYSC